MKRYEVSWRMIGKLEVSAMDNDLAQEIVSNMDDGEILSQSIILDVQVTGASNIPWESNSEYFSRKLHHKTRA